MRFFGVKFIPMFLIQRSLVNSFITILKWNYGFMAFSRRYTLMIVNLALICQQVHWELYLSDYYSPSFCKKIEYKYDTSFSLLKPIEITSSMCSAYKTSRNCNFVRKSGTVPLKLLFDKSLKGVIQIVMLKFRTSQKRIKTNGQRMRVETGTSVAALWAWRCKKQAPLLVHLKINSWFRFQIVKTINSLSSWIISMICFLRFELTRIWFLGSYRHQHCNLDLPTCILQDHMDLLANSLSPHKFSWCLW